MAEYTVGEEGASVFDADGHLLVRLGPGTTIVPGTIEQTVEPRRTGQQYQTRRGYDDKVIRPERGPGA